MQDKFVNLLICISKFEAFEKSFIDFAKSKDNSIFVFDTTDAVIIDIYNNKYFKLALSLELSSKYLINREIKNYFSKVGFKDIQRTIALGDAAGQFMTDIKIGSLSNDLLLTKEDIDFSRNKHSNRSSALANLINAHKRVFFETENAFSMAIDHGSAAQHFLLGINPCTEEAEKSLLNADKQTIGIIAPDDIDWKIRASIIEKIKNDLPSFKIKSISENEMFDTNIFHSEETLKSLLKEKLSKLSHLIIISSSSNVLSIIKYIKNDFNSIIILDSQWYRGTLWRFEHLSLLSPPHLLVSDLISKIKNKEKTFKKTGPIKSFFNQIDHIDKSNFSQHFEDFLCLKDNKPIGIFFSVTPIVDNNSGARAQRIRNMYYSFSDAGHSVIPVNSTKNNIERRTKFVETLMSEGTNFSFFYGENSTSPIDEFHRLAQLNRLLRSLDSHQIPIAWFIRDLHFMDDAIWPSAGAENLIVRAECEFQTISKFARIIYAPTIQTAQSFQMALPSPQKPELEWKHLPPGIGRLSTPPTVPESRVKLAFVYAGGLGPIYKMDAYLAVVRKFCKRKDIAFHFIIRTTERHVLDKAGISEKGTNIKFIFSDFDHYNSGAEYAIGVVPLESKYAQKGFPLKVANYLGRNMPVFCFDNMDCAQLIERNNVGIVVPESEAAIAETVDTLIKLAQTGRLSFHEENFEDAYEQNSWEHRCVTVLRDLNIID